MTDPLAELHARIRACRVCRYAHAPSPVVEGVPDARIFVVGQALRGILLAEGLADLAPGAENR